MFNNKWMYCEKFILCCNMAPFHKGFPLSANAFFSITVQPTTQGLKVLNS